MPPSPLRSFLAASLLTIGLALCIGALAIGHADDAPGVGLIGFGLFLFFAFIGFGIAGSGVKHREGRLTDRRKPAPERDKPR